MGVKEWFGAFTGASADEIRRVDPEVLADPVHIRVRDVHKYYGAHHVLKGLSFDIVRAKTNVIIGPSGSGKTVLMRQLIRLEKPDSGQILVNNRDFVELEGMELDAMRRTMGMVFQMSALFDSMSVFENVAFPLREHTKMSNKEIKERVMDRLESLGIGHAWNKSPAELSGGMQKRVAVARSLVLETDVLIYDEPTTGLDPITTCTVDELIAEAEEKFGVTSIVISHDMASVFRIADRITFMYFGEVQASGTPRELLESLNEPTARPGDDRHPRAQAGARLPRGVHAAGSAPQVPRRAARQPHGRRAPAGGSHRGRVSARAPLRLLAALIERQREAPVGRRAGPARARHQAAGRHRRGRCRRAPGARLRAPQPPQHAARDGAALSRRHLLRRGELAALAAGEVRAHRPRPGALGAEEGQRLPHVALGYPLLEHHPVPLRGPRGEVRADPHLGTPQHAAGQAGGALLDRRDGRAPGRTRGHLRLLRAAPEGRHAHRRRGGGVGRSRVPLHQAGHRGHPASGLSHPRATGAQRVAGVLAWARPPRALTARRPEPRAGGHLRAPGAVPSRARRRHGERGGIEEACRRHLLSWRSRARPAASRARRPAPRGR
ncbi:MAG: ATP-binding cassette domain-containing protein [Sandaracinaceae bacterium]|nr:ATP-binding cassette domain-containing protein [Sandaracinaceae bacterium]